jgi:uncharacterized sulfatase
MPHLSWCQPEHYSDSADMRQEIVRLAREGKLNAAQLTYAGPRKPLEELYDTQTDPHQIHNLASATEHQELLQQMRRRHRDWMFQTRDIGLLTEPEVEERCGPLTPYEWARQPGRYDLPRILEAADLVGRPEAVAKQIELLRAADSGVRYWAAVGLRAAGRDAMSARTALVEATHDRSVSVRIEAAAALAAQGALDAALPVLVKELQGSQLAAVLHAARTLELLGPHAMPAEPQMRQLFTRADAPDQRSPYWLFIRFSLDSALKQLKP